MGAITTELASELVELVGDRVQPHPAAPGTVRPHITVEQSGGRPTHHHGGTSRLHDVYVRVRCYSTIEEQARELAQDAIALLTGKRHQVVGTGVGAQFWQSCFCQSYSVTPEDRSGVGSESTIWVGLLDLRVWCHV